MIPSTPGLRLLSASFLGREQSLTGCAREQRRRWHSLLREARRALRELRGFIDKWTM